MIKMVEKCLKNFHNHIFLGNGIELEMVKLEIKMVSENRKWDYWKTGNGTVQTETDNIL